jgi:hypothetical protein
VLDSVPSAGETAVNKTKFLPQYSLPVEGNKIKSKEIHNFSQRQVKKGRDVESNCFPWESMWYSS